MIDTISGIVSLYVYEYNNKQYYFFGDIHHTRKNNCYEKGIACDAFNYNFSATTDAKTNCTTLGALLHHWFMYNNQHNIKTDFYVEEAYTKENERQDDIEYINMIKNRSTMNTRQGEPFKNKSWLQILPYIMAPCFTKEKQNCPYYPNVHVHYTDVRNIETKNGLIDITPFSIDSILTYISNHEPRNIQELTMIKKDILNLISYILSNFKTLLGYLLNNQILEYKKALLETNSKFIDDMIHNIDYFVSHGEFKIARELKRLKLKNPFIHETLLNFINMVTDTILFKIKIDEDNLRKNIHIIDLTFSHNYEVFLSRVKGYYIHFINLGAILMDVYTISRMFLQDGDQIIVYAGAYHINMYKIFFNLLSNPLISIPYVKGNSCITDELIPVYIHADKFKTNF